MFKGFSLEGGKGSVVVVVGIGDGFGLSEGTLVAGVIEEEGVVFEQSVGFGAFEGFGGPRVNGF